MSFLEYYDRLKSSGRLPLMLTLALVAFLLWNLTLIINIDARKRRWKGDKPPRLKTVLKAYRTPMMEFGWDFVNGLGLVRCRDAKSESIAVPEGVSVIRHDAFKDCAMKSIVLPETLREIEYGAFRNCTRLTEIKIPEKADRLGGSLFEGCTALRVIEMPYSSQIIGIVARGCDSLERLVIGGHEFEVSGGTPLEKPFVNRISVVLAADGNEWAKIYVKAYGYYTITEFIQNGETEILEMLLGSSVEFSAKVIDEVIEFAIKGGFH